MLLTFPQTRKNAFFGGLLKGLAAPVMIFHAGSAPEIPAPMTISPAGPAGEEAIRRDWVRLGFDVATVIERHE